VAEVVLTSDLLAFILGEFGSGEQRELIGPLLAGETLGSFALTEPNAGSDAAAIETRAERGDGSYVLSGTKAWITLADVADWAVVLAKTDPEAGTRGISAFLIERGDFRNGEEPYDMMGLRGTAVGELHLEGCRVPESAMVGDPGEGFKVALRALDSGRIGIAALAIGISPGRVRGCCRLRRAPRAVRASDLILSGHPVDAGGHGHGQ
jgi:butyryl-CoA dehydrogenase